MEFKGIKNKWENNNNEVIRADYLGASYKICEIVKDMPYPANEEIGIANAKLIAAAPELFEACKMARTEIAKGTADTLTVDVLEKALLKALGKNV